MGKAKPSFILVLGIFSMIGFLGIGLDALFKVLEIPTLDIPKLALNIGFLVLGIGFLIEAGLVHVIKRKRFDLDFPKIVTFSVGIFVIITGILSFFMENNPLLIIKIIMSFIAILTILWELFFYE